MRGETCISWIATGGNRGAFAVTPASHQDHTGGREGRETFGFALWIRGTLPRSCGSFHRPPTSHQDQTGGREERELVPLVRGRAALLTPILEVGGLFPCTPAPHQDHTGGREGREPLFSMETRRSFAKVRQLHRTPVCTQIGRSRVETEGMFSGSRVARMSEDYGAVDRARTYKSGRTTRRTPSVNLSTLKFTSSPTGSCVSFRYVMTCVL